MINNRYCMKLVILYMQNSLSFACQVEIYIKNPSNIPKFDFIYFKIVRYHLVDYLLNCWRKVIFGYFRVYNQKYIVTSLYWYSKSVDHIIICDKAYIFRYNLVGNEPAQLSPI